MKKTEILNGEVKEQKEASGTVRKRDMKNMMK